MFQRPLWKMKQPHVGSAALTKMNRNSKMNQNRNDLQSRDQAQRQPTKGRPNGTFSSAQIKVNKNQANNPAIRELVNGSYRLVESCANTVGGGNFGQDSIYEDF